MKMGFGKFIDRYKKRNSDVQDNQNNQDTETIKNKDQMHYIGIKKEVVVIGVILVVILFFIIYFASQINIEAFFSGKTAGKRSAVSKTVLSQVKKTPRNSNILFNLAATKKIEQITNLKNKNKKTYRKIILSGNTVPAIPAILNSNKANSSSILVIGNSSSILSSIKKAVANPLALQESILKRLNPKIDSGKSTPKSINQKNKAFLKRREKNKSITALVSSYHPFKFKTPFVITPGTFIPATLETGVNSQLPGPITALVSSNVYSHDLKYLLIPTGSLLIGRYNSSVGATQTRVLLAFTLIIFPNGKELQLPGFEGVSHRGYAGIKDIVDDHFWGMAKDVSLLTLIGFGVDESAGTETNMHPTPVQSFAESLSTNLGRVAETILENKINLAPTLKIRPGFTFNIVVTKNMLFKGQYKN